MRWHRAAIVVVLLLGCTQKRYVCEACLHEGDTECGKSNPMPHKDKGHARCDAANDLCIQLIKRDKESFERICDRKKFDPEWGCDKEVLDAMKFKCTESEAINLPLPGVK